MKKYILPFLFTSLLFSNPPPKKMELIAIDDIFVLESNGSEIFDNSISYTHKPLLKCEPKIEAVYKVQSGFALKVIPTTPLRSDTEYGCFYEKERLSFTTAPLTVVEARYIATEKLLRLSFSDRVTQKSLADGLVLQKIDKLSKTNLKYKILQTNEKDMVLEIIEPVQNSVLSLELTQKIMTKEGAGLKEVFVKRFNEVLAPVVLDKEKKPMVISDAPQMIALETGGFALRLFLDDSFDAKSDRYVEIAGIENFTVNEDNYIYHHMRKDYGISNTPYYYTDIISPEFKPNTSYRVTLKKGLLTYQELKEDKHYMMKTGDRAKMILFKGEKNYISNVGELGFSSVNIDRTTLVVERVLDDNLRYFMNFRGAVASDVKPYLKEIFTKEIALNGQKNEITNQKFSFKSLDKNLPFGVYKITMRYSDVVKKETKEREVSKVLFLSDLGISVNLAKEQAFVSIVSLSSAKPIANATVELYATNNDLLGSVVTNADGVAIIEKSQLLESMPKGVLVRTKEDMNFLALNSAIDTPSPHEILKKAERFKAHVYFQSNILRPASQLNALITVKDRDFISANRLPVKLELSELHGKTLHTKVYHTDEFGLINFNYQFDAIDKTGNYKLNVFIGDTDIGSKRLKVEAFVPPKIENSLATNKNIYKSGELIELNISSSYLFGSPASGLEGSVKLNAQDVAFMHKDYKGYSFSNIQLSRDNVKSYIDSHNTFLLDEAGTASVVLSSKVRQKVPSILEAMIGVTVMDDTQPVSNYKKIKIYPYEAMVGLKINKISFEKGQKLKGKSVLIDPLSGEVIKRKLYAVLKKINWHYTYTSGSYRWQKETKVVESFTLESNEEFSRNIHENGDYAIEVHDYFGGHSASANFDVWWWSYSNISPKNNLKSVEINFEDRLYKKGDTMEVTLKSPILEGQVFITLESDKVELYRRLELKKGVGKVSIPIEVDMGRGLYLHATAIRASDTPSTLIPFRAMGYKLVKPNRDEHKIKVKIEAPEVTKSKSSLALKITTSKSSKVLISIVDRGILQLVAQKKPKPFDFFNESAERKLSYYDLYDQLMSFVAEGTLIDFGAGDINRKKKHLAPDLGKRIKPFMIWSGIVDMKDKERNITIDIPEFNGRASVVAIAINGDSVGVVEQDIRIRDDVMLKPSYPLYALAGDKIDVPLRIFNTTKEPKIVSLSTTLSDNLRLELGSEMITIAPNSSEKIICKLHATKVGKGELMLVAKYGKETISTSVELPIYSPYALSTHTFKGLENQSKTFTPPKEYRDAKVMITLSTNLIGALREDLKYLVRYPHGCAEQTSSKISAMHYAKAFLQKDRLVGESENFIRQGAKKLQNMQNYYGEFNYWQGGESVHPYASLYAAQILLELKRDGTELTDSFINKIVEMLDAVSSANGSYEAKYTNPLRVYAAFILAEHKGLSESTANMLYEKGMYKNHFLSKFYMAAILKMQGKVDIAQKLYDESSYSLADYATKSYGNNLGYFESNTRDMFLHFIIKTAYFNREVKDLKIVQKEFSNLYSTQSKAVALKAISTYLGKPKNSKLDVNIKLNGKNENYTSPITFMVEKLKSSDITLSTNNSSTSYAIELIKHLPKEIKNSIRAGEELSIMREFIDESGNTLDLQNLIQGDKIYSKVTIANHGEIKNVVVSQRVPACLTIVNNNIKSQKAKYKDENIDQEYREIRDDRVLNFINLAKKEQFDKLKSRIVMVENRGVIYTPFIVTSQGECRLPAVVSEAMYDTRINDYAKEAESIVVHDINTPRTKIVIPKKSFEESAKELVLSLYKKETISNDADDFVEFFSYPMVKYYRTKDASKAFILKDKKNYFKDWAKRTYGNIKVETVGTPTDEVVKVKIIFDYLLDNGKKELKGESRHLLTVKSVEGRLVIVSIELSK
ncbi:MAG: hypothetical protein KAG56_04580 [Sulfurovaceae bacterium]|nr:hypothetical protein [Sulfurovaceae bacterium]